MLEFFLKCYKIDKSLETSRIPFSVLILPMTFSQNSDKSSISQTKIEQKIKEVRKSRGINMMEKYAVNR